MKLKNLLFTTVFILSALFSTQVVYAIDVPNFPSCQSYGGTPKVSYVDGLHGILGQPEALRGSDAVYMVSDTNLIQCFCSTTGQGIQTDWWMQNSLTEQQITSIKNLGWTFIPSGLPWGLSDTSYFAKNTYYNCGIQPTPTFSQPGPGGPPVCDSQKPGAPTLISVTRNGTQATLRWTAVAQATHYTISYGLKPNDYIFGVPNTGNVTTFTVNALDPNQNYFFAVKAVNNCMPSDYSVSSAQGQVLGLATTGNWVQILALASLATALIIASAYVRKNTAK